MRADGTTPRQDGVIWECSDFQDDGIHPSLSGRAKIARMLSAFFKTDPTANTWFIRKPPTSVEAMQHFSPSGFALEQNYPNHFNPATLISFQLPVSSHVMLQVFDVNGREVATLVDGNLEAGEHAVTFAPRDFPAGFISTSSPQENFRKRAKGF